MDVMYKFIDVFTVIAVLWVFVVFGPHSHNSAS